MIVKNNHMVYAIIVAGGKGARMRQSVRKQYLELAGKPLIGHTLIAFDACQTVDKVLLVIPQADVAVCNRIIETLGLQKKPRLIAGGVERQDSVYNGLQAIANSAQADDIVVVHDGVRPFVTTAMLEACIDGARETGACITGVPAIDTLKRIDSDGWVQKTIAREHIRMVQTPQAFEFALLQNAHAQALEQGVLGTDDAALVENGGGRVKIIDGGRFNMKITTPEDMVIAQMYYHYLNQDSSPLKETL